jgi:hypothetical protein
MRKMIGLFLLTLAVQPMLAKEDWPLTVTVLSTKNIEDPHGSFHLSWFSSNAGWSQSSGRAGWSHRIAEHAFVEASNGNSYELQPKNPKDMLLPGTYQAKIEKRDIKVCEPKDNGNCREVKFWVVEAVQTARAAEPTPKTAELSPASTAVAPSPAPPTPALPLSATQQALLSIESTPSGGDIEIDGAFVGNTPSTVNVGPGSHKIVVKKKGFAAWTKAISVTGGAVHLNAELEQEQPKQ